MTKPTESPETIYLIDGHAQIFRAFFAIRTGMTSPVTGEPTNATFGFVGMLMKLLTQCRPTHVVMAVDTKGATFRNELFPDYKGNRDAPPEELPPQIPRIIELTKLFGIPVLGHEGAEADDVMATLTRRVLGSEAFTGARVKLVSKDKDLEQLLNDRVSMYDIHTDTEIDINYLMEKKGIRPDQAVDLQVLTGDSVDNIPGVTGVGTKTAAKLLDQFGTVEGLLERLDEVKGKRKENIEKAKAFFPIARKLVTLDQHVNLDFELEATRLGAMDSETLLTRFKELGFNRHAQDLRRLLGDRGEEEAEAPAQRRVVDDAAGTLFGGSMEERPVAEAYSSADSDAYELVTTDAALESLGERLRGLAGTDRVLAVDTETTGLGWKAEMCGVCLSWEAGSGVYVPVLGPEGETILPAERVRAVLGPVMADATIRKVGHHFKFDLHVLHRAGYVVEGVVFDTMIGAALTGAPGLKLDDLALAMLEHRMIPIEQLIGTKPRRKSDPAQKTMDQVSLAVAATYSAEDADITLRLYEKLRPMVDERGMAGLLDEVETPLIAVLADMEEAGIRVDAGELDRQRERLEARIIELRDLTLERAEQAGATVPFNLDSPKQLADVLFNQLKLPVIKRTKTGPSTDAEVLERLSEREDLEGPAADVPKLLTEYRMLTKLVGTYLTSLKEAIDEETGRVHATFNQTGAATGRLSSSDPNLQNIPIRTEVGREVRRAFVAEPGKVLLVADYSQIELRVLAHLSEDPALIEAFVGGEDIHRAVAAEVFGVAPEDVTSEQRGHAKTINFGIIYGITAFGLARRIGDLDRTAAAALIEAYKSRFTGINTFLDTCVEQAKSSGYVATILGRRRAIPQIESKQPNVRSLGERLAINSVVQGSAADLIKVAMVRLHAELTSVAGARLLLQIHDELVVEADEAVADEVAGLMKATMEGAMELRVPLEVDLGRGLSWHEAK
ncbi:DNA polymerase I [Mucisphaera calidilacus]|uniref:DNA polymerase I n=1 Tax=Mucisphaera calidilacus TaxID=2527982 RepID=A0A518BYK4_9BACT|nr:DNA polymerase I [Mucisphaera calidilacus]QDU72050.1 DNA polymerase I [Mucisphaera calidilacus]